MYVIIVGGGEFGRVFAKDLAEGKNDVVIIEENEELCNELVEEVNAKIIHGDGTKLGVLKDAGLDEANVVATLTGKDETNLLCCLIAKDYKPTTRLATRISKDIYKKIFDKAGVDIVISPETSSADMLDMMITEPHVLDVASVHKGKIALLEYKVTNKSKVRGKGVEEIEKSGKLKLVSILRKGKYLIATREMKILLDDRVIIVVKPKDYRFAKKLFE